RYALLTGRAPFESRLPSDTIQKILTEPPPSPKTIHLAIPELFSDLVLHLLAKTPADRPDSATSVFRELVRVEKFTGPV
ncbi:MAG TPA: serine/threonine protein kinase, partial [Planctomycetaceae bacterium]|nr:serine/threonine protein kinase [Planctomycetaceae bacterium]